MIEKQQGMEVLGAYLPGLYGLKYDGLIASGIAIVLVLL